MATDGPDPAPCDRELWERGEVVLVTHSIPPNAFEVFVRRVARESGQRVDWHYVGGRNVVRALGDIEAVKATLDRLEPEHQRLRREGEAHYLTRPTDGR